MRIHLHGLLFLIRTLDIHADSLDVYPLPIAKCDFLEVQESSRSKSPVESFARTSAPVMPDAKKSVLARIVGFTFHTGKINFSFITYPDVVSKSSEGVSRSEHHKKGICVPIVQICLAEEKTGMSLTYAGRRYSGSG